MYLKRYLTMIRLLLIRDKRKKADYIRKKNLIHFMGENCGFQPNKLPSEPFLLAILNNVSVAANVNFYTHDITCDVFNGSTKFKHCGKHEFYMGKIEIFDNCFIGANSVITYNTKIGPNAIVAAGAVVVKDVPEGCIVGGNPAKVIGNVYDLENKRYTYSKEIKKIQKDDLENFFWKEN